MLGLRCSAGFSLVAAGGGCSRAVGGGSLVAAASLGAEPELWSAWSSEAVAPGRSGARLHRCGSLAWTLRGTWGLPGPGTTPVPPALAGRLFTTGPPGTPYVSSLRTGGPVFGASQHVLRPRVHAHFEVLAS